MVISERTIALLRLGLKIGGAAATVLAGAGYWRNISYSDMAIGEAAAGGGLVLYGLWRGYRDQRWRNQEQNWMRVEATITKSVVGTTFVWGGGATAYYVPDIRYRFTCLGVEREGTRVQMDPGANPSEDEVTEWVARYPVGATITAYCDPKNANRSVLELDDEGSGLAIIAMGLIPVFAVYAIAFEVMSKNST